MAQGEPQVPQFSGSVWVLVQTSAGVPGKQVVLGGRHAQAPPEQTFAGVQTIPHPPQLAPLVSVFTQVPVAGSGGQRAVGGGGGLQAHVPVEQVPRPQARPQVPQLAASVARFTHERPQVSGRSAGQAQSPALQSAPALQVTLHAPQCRVLDFRSTQLPAQEVWPVGQEVDDVQPAATAETRSARIQALRATHLANECAIDHLPGGTPDVR
jgi:hypothetical protein